MEGAAIGIMAARAGALPLMGVSSYAAVTCPPADFAETFRAARKASLASLADGNRSEGSGATIRPMN